MTWTVPDDTFDYYPEGTCACSADLGDAADLGVARSYQRKRSPSRRLRRSSMTCTIPVRVLVDPHGAPLSLVPIRCLMAGLMHKMAVYLGLQHVPV